jgi:3-phosphoglycerate kinase
MTEYKVLISISQFQKLKRLNSLSPPSGTGAVGGAMLEYFEGKVLPGIAAVQS